MLEDDVYTSVLGSSRDPPACYHNAIELDAPELEAELGVYAARSGLTEDEGVMEDEGVTEDAKDVEIAKGEEARWGITESAEDEGARGELTECGEDARSEDARSEVTEYEDDGRSDIMEYDATAVAITARGEQNWKRCVDEVVDGNLAELPHFAEVLFAHLTDELQDTEPHLLQARAADKVSEVLRYVWLRSIVAEVPAHIAQQQGAFDQLKLVCLGALLAAGPVKGIWLGLLLRHFRPGNAPAVAFRCIGLSLGLYITWTHRFDSWPIYVALEFLFAVRTSRISRAMCLFLRMASLTHMRSALSTFTTLFTIYSCILT